MEKQNEMFASYPTGLLHYGSHVNKTMSYLECDNTEQLKPFKGLSSPPV